MLFVDSSELNILSLSEYPPDCEVLSEKSIRLFSGNLRNPSVSNKLGQYS